MSRILDTDRVKELLEQATYTGSWDGSKSFYGVCGRLARYYGVEATEKAMDAAITRLISGTPIENITGFLSRYAKTIYQKQISAQHMLSATEVHWVEVMDIDGLISAIQDLKTRSGRAENLVMDWTDKDIEQEVLYLKCIRHEWDAVRSIERARRYEDKARIEKSYLKSVENIPIPLLRSAHELRVERARKQAKDDRKKFEKVPVD